MLFALGDYLLDRDQDSAWTQTIIDALALLGFDERATRQAIARTAAMGWLVSGRSGRRVRWRLTEEGRNYLDVAKKRLFAPGLERDWDGEWLVLLVTMPENQRKLRNRLRTALEWEGFGSPAQGVWLSPHAAHAAEARRVIDSLGSSVQGTILHARLDDPGERHRLVAQAWSVNRLDARHRAFIAQWTKAAPATPDEAFVSRTRLVYEYRLLMLADPRLPPGLLPPDWSGERARLLVLDRHAQWEPLAVKWWDDREAMTSTAQ